jgi:hypothetical protein
VCRDAGRDTWNERDECEHEERREAMTSVLRRVVRAVEWGVYG